MKKVIVGMSGGVDSSVAAYLLKKQGYEIEGVSFILYETRLKKTLTGCCSIEAINEAKRTSEYIGIKLSVVDLRDEFMVHVIEPFIEAYSKGLTPNPCILCNKHIKFPYLMKISDEKGADFISTGHYARVEINRQTGIMSQELDNMILLKKGIDAKKDQSYVLYVLKHEKLNRLILPLGEMRKVEVREIARGINLPAAKRPESQEICFIEDRNYFKFLDSLLEAREGSVIDIETGKTIGIHRGIHLFTIGQRKRLGIATGKPLYVVKIDALKNAVYVGSREAAMTREFEVKDINWLFKSVETCREFRASVKVRSTMKEQPASIVLLNNNNNHVKVIYDEPQWAPAPGQSAVFYDGDIVLGGGIIQ